MGLWAESRAKSLPKTLPQNLRFEEAIWGQGELLLYLPQPISSSQEYHRVMSYPNRNGLRREGGWVPYLSLICVQQAKTDSIIVPLSGHSFLTAL